jgi:hypothetical protein
MERQGDRDLSQPTRLIEGCRESLGLVQICQSAPQVATRVERRAQGEPEIDGLLARVARLRQMRERTERLLEVSHSFVVSRPRHGLLPCLPAIHQGLIPYLSSQGVVRQAVHLLGYPASGEGLQGLHDACM